MAWWHKRPQEPSAQAQSGSGLPASAELFETWLEEMDAKLTGFEMFGLPEQFRSRRYTRESLTELQDVARDRLGSVEQVTDGSDTAFVDGAIRYVGETLIRHAGGGWTYTTDPDAPHRGRPVLVLDHPGSTEDDPVDVLGLLRETVRDHDHDWLTEAFDIHVAAAARARQVAGAPQDQQPASEPGSRLEAWLADMDEEIQRWRTGPGAPAERWDGSIESLDLLGRWALQHLPPGTDPRDPDSPHYEALQGAARYFGQTLLRHGGGHWAYNEDEPSETDPFAGQAWVTRGDPDTKDNVFVVPQLTLAAAVIKNNPGGVARKAASYLRSAPPR